MSTEEERLKLALVRVEELAGMTTDWKTTESKNAQSRTPGEPVKDHPLFDEIAERLKDPDISIT